MLVISYFISCAAPGILPVGGRGVDGEEAQKLEKNGIGLDPRCGFRVETTIADGQNGSLELTQPRPVY